MVGCGGRDSADAATVLFSAPPRRAHGGVLESTTGCCHAKAKKGGDQTAPFSHPPHCVGVAAAAASAATVASVGGGGAGVWHAVRVRVRARA